MKADQAVDLRIRLRPANMAVVTIDMWHTHFCKKFRARVDEMALRLNDTLDQVRSCGVRVIHVLASSRPVHDDWPQARAAYAFPRAPSFGQSRDAVGSFVQERLRHIPGAKGNRCECSPPCNRAGWIGMAYRLHPGITLGNDDLVIAGPAGTALEVRLWNVCYALGITRLFYTGVAMNLCVLNRPYGMIFMSMYHSLDCVLVRDLSEPFWVGPPFVAPEEARRLVLQHIEGHIAPTITSAELVAALREEA